MGAYLLRDGQRAAGPRDVGIREITALRDLSPRRSASGLLLIAAKITPERRRLVATVTRPGHEMRLAKVRGDEIEGSREPHAADAVGGCHPVAPDGCAPQ